MKRYFDLTRAIDISQIDLLGNYKSYLTIEEYAQLLTEPEPATIYYLPGMNGSGNTIDNLYSGKFLTNSRIIVTEIDEGDIITCDVLNDDDDIIKTGESVILITGWANRNLDKTKFYDKSPIIGKDFAEWLVRKNVGLFITDLPMLSNMVYMPEFAELIKIFAIGNVGLITGIAPSSNIQSGYANVVAVPCKIKGANWSFVRVIITD